VRAEPRAQFSVIEFDPDTFRTLLDYLHTGSCPLTCSNIPGLICAAEHYDLPELLQACFHHAKQFLRIEVVSRRRKNRVVFSSRNKILF
jgi:RAP1 GTPase activating protein 1